MFNDKHEIKLDILMVYRTEFCLINLFPGMLLFYLVCMCHFLLD